MKNLRNGMIISLLLTFLLMPPYAYGQSGGESTAQIGPRKQISMIFLSGLAGSVLGLSTLSFYGRPQDNLGNIAIGFAVGVVFGTIYVTYNTATRSVPTVQDSGFGVYKSDEIARKDLVAKKEKKLIIPVWQYQF